MAGWFALKHGVSKHPLLKGKPERIAIWVWLVDNAVWKDTPHDVNGRTVIIKRGQVAVSQRRLAEEVGVGRQVVRSFIERLTSEHMVNPDVTHGKTVLSLCNYEKYQAALKHDNPPPNPAVTHDQPIKEQDNNIPVGADRNPPPEVVEFEGVKATAWKVGKAYLSRHGVKDPGSLIGNWLKRKNTATEILAAIEAAEKAQTQDPVPYLMRILSGEVSNGRPKDGDRKTQSDGRVLEYADGMGWVEAYQ